MFLFVLIHFAILFIYPDFHYLDLLMLIILIFNYENISYYINLF